MPPSPPIQQQQQEVTATLTSSRASNLIQDIISEEPSPPYTPYPSPGEQSLLFGPQRPWETTINPQSTHQQQSYLSSIPQDIYARNVTILDLKDPENHVENVGIYFYYPHSIFITLIIHQNYLPLNHSSNISSSGSAYNITGGNVMFAKPGDAALGGWLCTNCRGSGQTQSLMGGGLCSRCRGVGRLFQ
ncbi:9368_t:CDS:2 [Ambispora gerdemannii]|uniref:9368_t:CDS:1 n=1 Tax=Ambispora gerdemannii TaxID=144530 RepID=A0A9N9DHX5_9GLOM|nr:9368_t:CDS:2 [Ambispora gerdemannii]